jgi:hypothetical protein
VEGRATWWRTDCKGPDVRVCEHGATAARSLGSRACKLALGVIVDSHHCELATTRAVSARVRITGYTRTNTYLHRLARSLRRRSSVCRRRMAVSQIFDERRLSTCETPSQHEAMRAKSNGTHDPCTRRASTSREEIELVGRHTLWALRQAETCNCE